MEAYLPYDHPTYREKAAAILQRYEDFAAEANITSAIRDFLIETKLANPNEIHEEKSPALGSRHAVDLTALDTFVEVKRRIGSSAGFVPDQEYVDQIDGYLAESGRQGSVRMGILTDGKYWLLRWPNLGPVKTAPPYGFTLDDPGKGFLLFEWLRDRALFAMEDRIPDRETIAERFSVKSPSYERDIENLRGLYAQNAESGTIAVKRQLWETLLTAALGEIAFGEDALDDLFVRHTYLTAVVGMVVQARFGLDIVPLAESDPADLLQGDSFRSKTGLQGIVESDFFTWPTEVDDGLPLLKTLARAVTRFNWRQAPTDIASILYETVIPPEERRQLGEYYTPDWLARAIVEETVTEPLTQEVLDPACGSGSFIAEAVRHYLAAAEGELTPEERLEWLRLHITGMDIHPVAVHLARSAWALAAEEALKAASETERHEYITAPIYLGDSLQTRYRNGDMFSETTVSVEVEDESNRRLEYPRRLVEDADKFDSLMGDLASAIERGSEPRFVLNDHGITDAKERETLQATIATLQSLHAEGRDHIWAYYTRNLVRPVVLANKKVDRIVGNPPWLTYNKTKDTFRSALERMSKSEYGIWAGGRYATHQDIAGLFFTRCVDLYLKEGGVIGMVMPHSALQAGQYSRWRTGAWRTKSTTQSVRVNFGVKAAWDLEKLDPNTFFPIASSVVFAARLGQANPQGPLQGGVEQWEGRTGTVGVTRSKASITDTSARGGSPYVAYSTQGAVIVPRCLFFVVENEKSGLFLQAPGTTIVDPRRGTQDKKPWNALDLTVITDQSIETQHVFNVHLGETVVPYATLDPLKAVLPLKRGENVIPFAQDNTDEGESPATVAGGIDLGRLLPRMR
ncbi:MAG: N-6 DNA methylase, partial [Chloroflexota bacterium]|nr:N-6 DNA methylase [Chloroflexota bacterium]